MIKGKAVVKDVVVAQAEGVEPKGGDAVIPEEKRVKVETQLCNPNPNPMGKRERGSCTNSRTCVGKESQLLQWDTDPFETF